MSGLDHDSRNQALIAAVVAFCALAVLAAAWLLREGFWMALSGSIGLSALCILVGSVLMSGFGTTIVQVVAVELRRK